MTTSGFFRHRVALVILILLAILYGGMVPLALWVGDQMARRGDLQMSRFSDWGAFWYTLVASLAIAAWWMIRRNTRRSLSGAGVAITLALFVVTRTWIAGLVTGRNPFPRAEMFFICLPMLYVAIYAIKAAVESGAVLSSTPSSHGLLEEAARLESSDKAQAITLYERIIRDHPNTAASSEATRNLEILRRP